MLTLGRPFSLLFGGLGMRQVFLLAGCFFLLGGASAWGQVYGLVTCTATASPAQMLSQGGTEDLGEIVVTCVSTHARPSARAFGISVSVWLLEDPWIPGSNFGVIVSNPVLTINENSCDNPSLTGGTYSSCGAPDSRFQDPQVGVIAASGQAEWHGVAFPNPG